MQKDGILCKKVTRKYGDLTALRAVDLEIKSGDFFVLYGPNGAGKTTLMKILCGLLRPTTGNATVMGEELHESEIRQKVGVISHNSFLYNQLTAHENLSFYAELYGVKSPGAVADMLLKSVELYERRGDFAGTFSRGMTQRLSIARALVADPDFIFLDEPFSGLDVHSATIFRDLLRSLHQQKKTVMMITHDMAIGLSVASHIGILKRGKLVFNEKSSGMTIDKLKKVYIEKVEQ